MLLSEFLEDEYMMHTTESAIHEVGRRFISLMAATFGFTVMAFVNSQNEDEVLFTYVMTRGSTVQNYGCLVNTITQRMTHEREVDTDDLYSEVLGSGYSCVRMVDALVKIGTVRG
jgi:hypothetical protein